MGYAFFKGNCDQDCSVSPFDDDCAHDPFRGYEVTPTCAGLCIECARMAGPCACTCKQYGFRSVPEINGVDTEAGSPSPTSGGCFCGTNPETNLPIYSVGPDYVLTKVFFRWTESGIDVDKTFAAIALSLSPLGGSDWSLSIYRDKFDGTTNLACPTKLTDWLPVKLNGGSDTFVMNPTPSDTVYALASDVLQPSDTGVCNLAPPLAFLAVARAGLGGAGPIMAICPMVFDSDGLSVFCDGPHVCCFPRITDEFSDRADGSATIHLSISVGCDERCDDAPGSGTIEFPNGEHATIPFDTKEFSTSFDVPWDGGDGECVTVVVTWTTDTSGGEGCAGCEPQSVTDCIPI